MDPINYSIDVQAPFQAALQGYQGGAAIRTDQQQQQQQQQALQQQQAQQQAMQRLMANPNPTAKDYSDATLLIPGMKDQFKQAWDMRNNEQQQNDLSHVGQVYAALQSRQPGVAAQLLRGRATALRNSGNEQDAKHADVMASVVEEHPELVKSMVGMKLAAIPGGDKVISGAAGLGAEQRASEQAPAELAKKQADAAKAGIDAKYAEQGAVLDLQKKGWDITKIQQDISIQKEANRIAAMNAAAAREGNALKREELKLKIAEARQALDDKIRAKVAETESAATAIDNSLNTIERIKANKKLDNVLGSIEGRVPSLTDEENDAISLIETLGSQVFLSQIPAMKGTGALSNAEGDKLQSALTNLSRVQSEKQFRANLDEASRLLKKGRETLSKRTGVPLASPDTPAAPGSRPPLSSFGG